MCDGGQCVCDAGYKGQYCTINVFSERRMERRFVIQWIVASMECVLWLWVENVCVMKGIELKHHSCLGKSIHKN